MYSSIMWKSNSTLDTFYKRSVEKLCHNCCNQFHMAWDKTQEIEDLIEVARYYEIDTLELERAHKAAKNASLHLRALTEAAAAAVRGKNSTRSVPSHSEDLT